MRQFDIGDLVQVTSMDTDWYNYVCYLADYIGDLGPVIFYTDNCVRVEFECPPKKPVYWDFKPDWLTLIAKNEVKKAEKHTMEKFNIQDTVELVKMEIDWPGFTAPMKKWLGKVGTVIEVYEATASVQFADDVILKVPTNWLRRIKKQEKKYWTGKVVCVESCSHYFTKGKVYRVTDGNLYDNDPPHPYLTHVESVDYINQGMALIPCAKFIIFRGYADERKDQNG